MAAITFDTLAYSESLQKAGIPREQAEAMAKANAKAFGDMVATRELATKKDLLMLRHDILKWMVTAMIAQTALLVGILAFLR